MCLQVGFVIFWQKDFGAKAAHEMLVKLTPGGQSSYLYLDAVHFVNTMKYHNMAYRHLCLKVKDLPS